MKRKFSAILGAVLLAVCLCVPAYAKETPDLSKEGSISVTMKYEGNAVSGGTLTLHRVGDIVTKDGDYTYALSDTFAEGDVSLEDITSADTAKKLESFADTQKLSGITEDIGTDGMISFDKVTPGLYLIVQNTAAKGFHKADAFLISVPMNEDGSYIYDVDASPKVELEKTTKPTTPPGKTTPPPPRLPQTGQLNWPIPILSVAGLLFLLMGWKLRTGRGEA